MTWASALSIHRLLTGPDSLVVVRLFGARPFWLQLFEIVDFRKRSVGGGVFYGPVPNVLGFVFFRLILLCGVASAGMFWFGWLTHLIIDFVHRLVSGFGIYSVVGGNAPGGPCV
ncbi:MAG: hypothetical protein VCE75_05760 [Alphaproteobacteria bacterium]